MISAPPIPYGMAVLPLAGAYPLLGSKHSIEGCRHASVELVTAEMKGMDDVLHVRNRSGLDACGNGERFSDAVSELRCNGA